MIWQNQLMGDKVNWLLEAENPGVRYLALRDLLDKNGDDLELISARRTAHSHGPISLVLDNMLTEGWWEKAHEGYNPKYRSTVWSIILLAQLGAWMEEDERIKTACTYLMENNLKKGMMFSTSEAPSGTVDCLQGNLLWALLEMGYDDPRLDAAFEWMARTVTGEGMAPKTDPKAERRYYAYKCGPLFECGANIGKPCAWGATKVMLAFSKLPYNRRTALINSAIQLGVEFLLGTDPAKADWPSGMTGKPSSNWWKFGFPVFYITDILQVVEALVGLGNGSDPRLGNALELIRQKQDANGRWPLEYDYAGKTWGNYGVKKQPNKWVTLRALRVLKRVG